MNIPKYQYYCSWYIYYIDLFSAIYALTYTCGFNEIEACFKT